MQPAKITYGSKTNSGHPECHYTVTFGDEHGSRFIISSSVCSEFLHSDAFLHTLWFVEVWRQQ